MRRRKEEGSVARSWLNVLFLIAVVALVFSPTFHHGFIGWDDNVHCYDNPNIRSLDRAHLTEIFTSQVNKTYIPLTILSFAVEYHFFKGNPFIYHLDNVLLHAGVVVALYWLALRLGLPPRGALLAALVFAIHPMHVESVAWVTQRKDVLYSLFYLLACLYYVRFLQSQRPSKYRWSLLFGMFGILAKPMALSLPLILCLIEWFVRGRLKRLFWLDKIPFVLTIFPVAWLTYQSNMRTVDLSLTHAPLVWLWSMSFYLLKFFIPTEYLALYQLPVPVSLLNPEFVIALAVAAALAVLVIIFRRKRWFIFAVLYFLLSIFFLLRFDNKQDLSFVADRFMYLPSLGFCLWIGWGIDRLLQHKEKRPWLVMTMTALLCAGLGLMAHRQTKIWGDEYVLWSRVVEHYPSGAAYNHLGNYFLEQRDYAQALSYYDRGIAIDPTFYKAYGNRGIIHMKEGNFEPAIADLTAAIRLASDDAANAYNNRGYAYYQMKNLDAAFEDFNRAVAADPKHVKAYMNRATIYKDRKNFNAALQDLNRAQRINPDDVTIQRNIDWLKRRMMIK